MELALVFSASAAGMALGALTVTFLLDGIEKARLSFALVIQFALMMMLLFFIRDAWMVIAVLGAAGFVFGAFPPMARSIVQRSIPENIRGSVLGTRMMLLSLSSPCGAALAAWLVSTMHVSPLTSVACAATTVLAVALALWIWTPTSALVQ